MDKTLMISFLTDLDTLYDTRLMAYLATIGNMSNEEYGAYLNRRTDDFKFMDRDTFYELYKDRSKFIFPHPDFRTRVLPFITELLLDAQSTAAVNNESLGYSLTINTAPYEFTKEMELNLATIINTVIPMPIEIRFISLSEIKTEYLKEYNNVILYDGMKLLEKAFREENIQSIQNKHFIVPAIATSKEGDTEDANAAIDELKTNLSPILYLDMVNVDVFSYKKET